jgi:hypothetical protein
MRLYFVFLPLCTVATAVKARCASVAFGFWVRSESLCAIITRADWSLAAVYCDIYKEMNLTLGEQRTVSFSGTKSVLSYGLWYHIYRHRHTSWIDGKHEFLGRTFLLLSLEYFFFHWEALQNTFFSKRFSPYMGRLTTKPLRLSSCSSSSALAFL